MLLSEMYVTKSEFIGNVIPKKLFVIGPNLISDRKRFFKDYNVDVVQLLDFKIV